MNTINHSLIDEVSVLLTSSVSQIFGTVFDLTVQRGDVEEVGEGDENLIACSVSFVGDVNGTIHIYLKSSFAGKLAGHMLGMEPHEFEGEGMVNDVMGELGNMIVGTVQSRLCDFGFPCVLTIPSVMRTNHPRAATPVSAECRQLSILCESERILLLLQLQRTVQNQRQSSNTL